jgi:hypothetical protein
VTKDSQADILMSDQSFVAPWRITSLQQSRPDTLLASIRACAKNDERLQPLDGKSSSRPRVGADVTSLSKAIDEMQQAFAAISDVIADDGRPLVDSRGVDYRICSEWRDGLRKIDEELVIWGRTFKRAFGTESSPAPREDSLDGGDTDPIDDRDDGHDVSDPELQNDWAEQDSQTGNKLSA